MAAFLFPLRCSAIKNAKDASPKHVTEASPSKIILGGVIKEAVGGEGSVFLRMQQFAAVMEQVHLCRSDVATSDAPRSHLMDLQL